MKQEYEVKLELFEGPLDLLLYLVNKAEVNIADIQVSQIAMQYCEYLDLMRELNIDVAAEYLHMAATLIRLKARELLPPSEQEELTGEEDGIYNREQLIAQLLEYKKFKEAAGTLKVFESEQFGAFGRGKPDQVDSSGDDDEVYLGSVSIFDLLTAFKRVLERAEDPENEYRHVVHVDNCKIDDRIEFVLALLSETGEVKFETLFEGDHRKIVIVVTFMALLELVKMQEIRFRQEAEFGQIYVQRRLEKDPELLADMQRAKDELEARQELSGAEEESVDSIEDSAEERSDSSSDDDEEQNVELTDDNEAEGSSDELDEEDEYDDDDDEDEYEDDDDEDDDDDDDGDGEEIASEDEEIRDTEDGSETSPGDDNKTPEA